MEEFELRSQILLGEDSTRQFKREPSADAKMAGEIVAFANSGGGRIYVGVEKDYSGPRFRDSSLSCTIS
jgi:ATP-dependent DNA helicase RecG